MSDTPTPRTDAHMDESIPEGVDKYDLLESFARELDEQVLCNGKGAEREADLLGKVERLERENARLREALKFYADQQSYGLNGGSSQRIYSDAGKRAREALALAIG